MRFAGMPAAISSSMSAWMTTLDSSMPSHGCLARSSSEAMSYHEGIAIPPLSVTGETGAFGRTNLTCGSLLWKSAATSVHPMFVSPRPWIGPTNVA
eukprot:1920871-Prymnesium_polylepis.2